MPLACHDIKSIDRIKTKLKYELEMKDLGQAKIILGIKNKSDIKICTLYVNHFSYMNKMCEKNCL